MRLARITLTPRFTTFSSLWVLHFRVLGAPFSRFMVFVFEIWVLRASVFVFETTLVLAQSVEHVTAEREVTGSFPGGRTNIQGLKITEK